MTDFERVLAVDIDPCVVGFRAAYEKLVGNAHPRIVTIHVPSGDIFLVDEIVACGFPRWLGLWETRIDPSLPPHSWYVEYDGKRCGSTGA